MPHSARLSKVAKANEIQERALAEIGDVSALKLTRDVVLIKLGKVPELLGQSFVQNIGIFRVKIGFTLLNDALNDFFQVGQREQTLGICDLA